MRSPKKPTRDQITFEVLRLLRDQPAASVARVAGISSSTISKLRRGPRAGGTRYPQNLTIDLILESQGYHRPIIRKR
jgi:hypothetical protein